jgi:uncharacterized protein (DUF2249 family)
MNSKINTLDVREDIRAGRHPFEKIQNALNVLHHGEALRLLVPFEPVPLYAVAASKGLGHKATQISDKEWEVLFGAALEPISELSPEGNSTATDVNTDIEVIDVDARGLEPPQPMILILETLPRVPRGVKLRARTDRRPVHLYAHLEERGFVGESEEQNDGSFITYIRRA